MKKEPATDLTLASQIDEELMSTLNTDLTAEQVAVIFQFYEAKHGPETAKRLIKQKLGRGVVSLPKVYHQLLLQLAMGNIFIESS